jgi:ParB/RepB/Spo0J family partition protein
MHRDIPLDQIRPSKGNPRKSFNQAKLEELTESVRQVGVLEPILVRNDKGTEAFELVAGERRYRAAKAAGLTSVPAIVKDLTDVQVLEIQVIENAQRDDLHPLEEAEGFRRLMAIAKQDAAKIAERIGRSAKYVYDRVKLLQLTKEAQQLFFDGVITAGHAIILARLKPKDQARAISTDVAPHRGNQALFAEEYTLWDPAEDGGRKPKPRPEPHEGLKVRSVRELQAWVDEHVRFDPETDDLPNLFPETLTRLKEAKTQREEVISITHEHYVQPDARTKERVFGPRSWKRADGVGGSKRCDYGVTGVVVIGPERGEAFRVCTAKEKCNTHWAAEQREKKRRAASSAKGTKDERAAEREREAQKRQREQEAKDAAARKRWEKAAPAIRKAVAAAVLQASAAPAGVLGKLLLEQERWDAKGAAALVPIGDSAESLVRHLAFRVLYSEIGYTWRAHQEFPTRMKALGLDVAPILDEAAPVQTSAEPAKGKAAKKSKPKAKRAKAAAPKRGAVKQRGAA